MSNETGDGARQIALDARCRCQGSCGSGIPTTQDSAIGFNELLQWLDVIKEAFGARKLSDVLGLLAQDLEEIGLNLQQPGNAARAVIELNALLKH